MASFIRRATSDWELASKNMQRSVGLQQKYYNKRNKDILCKVGNLVLLSTRNIKIKGIPRKLQKKFVGPFEISKKVGQRAYRLSLPKDWEDSSCVSYIFLKILEGYRPTKGPTNTNK